MVVLQEETMDINDTNILFGKCNDRRQLRVNFSVYKNIIPAITNFEVVNSRIAILTIEVKWFDIVFVNIHASTQEKTQKEKDDFYDELESILENTPDSKIQIILGDMNAKISREQMFNNW